MKTENYFLFLAFSMLLSITAMMYGCKTAEPTKPTIAVTILPQQQIAEQITGDHFQIFCVVPAGSNPEAFDPSPSLIIQLSKSVGYLRVGSLGFEMAWMEKIKQNSPSMEIFRLDRNVELIHGTHICSEHSHDHDHFHEEGTDPHYWSSPKSLRIMAAATCDALIKLAPQFEEEFVANLDSLLAEIDDTDRQLTELLAPLKQRTFMIYHPSLAYFARDYNLEQIAIEEGGKEPTPAHLKKLIDTARSEQVRVIFVQREFDTKNAEIIAKEVGATIVQIDPLAYDWKEELLKIAKLLSNDK